MATIHFGDNTTKKVTEEQAEAIEAILLGNEKPSSSAQAEFCSNVSNVTFGDDERLETPVNASGKGYASFVARGAELKRKANLSE
jgi:hypothetical protein